MEVTFKVATEEDIEGVIDLCNECFDETTSYEFAKGRYNQTKDDPNQIYLIGLVDDKIIAHARLSIVSTMFEEMNTFSILNHFCVKKEFRRHNIATHMLDVVSEVSKEYNCVSIKLWSNNVRVAAHSCYKKFGFIKNDAGFFSKDVPVDADFFSKDI